PKRLEFRRVLFPLITAPRGSPVSAATTIGPTAAPRRAPPPPPSPSAGSSPHPAVTRGAAVRLDLSQHIQRLPPHPLPGEAGPAAPAPGFRPRASGADPGEGTGRAECPAAPPPVRRRTRSSRRVGCRGDGSAPVDPARG